ncbi:protein vav-like [Centruroides sculpturatus]|uniref:protein vav-like n=1 Tax=Centruroides sculpturatus TaxID=218467 RepID=UPI000C6DB217|nr:protein vav-like [Centruroides sculpturatus]
MDRDTATAKIEKLPTGTFLLRISPKQNGAYVISLNYDNNVKHMKVYTREGGQLYYLSESKYFKSVVELIKWYEENSLADSFHGLNSKLSYPFKMIVSNNVEPLGYATAIYNFSPETPNMLALKKGDRVTILSKAGGKKGWWKGQIGERIGYFPLTYVSEVND